MGNEKYIKEFEKYNRSKGLAHTTIDHQTRVMNIVKKHIRRDFKTITRTDVENYLLFLQDNGYSKSSMELTKVIVKKFFKWMHDNQMKKEISKIREKMLKNGKTQLEIDRKEWELRNYRPKYQMCVAWISPKPVKTNKTEKDIFTPEEIYKMINACDHPQHKALISLMWDCALRVGQTCDIKLGDLTIKGNKIDISFKLDWDEVRTIPAIESTPTLFEWLNNHPYKNQPDKYLFISMSPCNYGNRYAEMGVYGILERIRKRAGLKKHIHPHLIRHSRITYWKRNMVDSSTIKFIGLWKMDSPIPDTVYNHQNANDYRNNVITATTGIPTIETALETNPMNINYCSRCGEGNPATNQYCLKCREPQTGLAKQKQEEMIKQQITEQVKELLRRETEPDVRTYDKPIEDILAHPEEPATVTVVEKQPIPTQEELFEKYKQLERIVEKLKQA